MPKLVASAIKLKDGRIFTGKRHSDAIIAAKEAGIDRLVIAHATHGFTTKNGIFFDRVSALDYALDSGQVSLPLKGGGLTSEDLW